jgi:Insertion element 4 transposase N-terminal/Transposase DDE domain
MMQVVYANVTAEVSMPVSPSSRIASAFQQLLPVDLPELEGAPGKPPSTADCGRRKGSPEFSFGLLTALCPPALVDRVVEEAGRQERRCRLLPARLVVYALLVMCMCADLSYTKLMQRLGGLARIGRWAVPHRSAFVRARERLGWEVMEGLFRALARPLGDPTRDQYGIWRGRRVVAIDGTTLELARNHELEQAFGGQRANDRSGRRVGPPLIRMVALIECGTRALLDVAYGHYDTGENSLARLVRGLVPGMLVLADRGFPSKPLWQAYVDAGADLLWRAKAGIARRRICSLPDGSYLAKFGRGEPLTVRVIEYRLGGSRETYRLLTNLLDPCSADAVELAQLYNERWECETLTREIKIGQCHDGSLRSQTELGVRQELWASCVLHTLIRRLIYQAAASVPERDPDRISFSLAQDAVRHSVGRVFLIGHHALHRALQTAAGELAALRHLVSRRPRSCPRLEYKSQSRYGNRANSPLPRSSPRPPREVALLGA